VRLAIVPLLLLGISLPATAADRPSKPKEEDQGSYQLVKYYGSQKRAGYRSHRETHSARYRRVITPADKQGDRCILKAWKAMIRCQLLGYDIDSCFFFAMDYQGFCMEHGL
jgi:hypothetical protein